MDEPTNHLDVETVEALGRALNSFKVNPLFNSNILLIFLLDFCEFNLHKFLYA